MVYKVVLTGGPGSGKTEVLEKLNTYFTEQGFKVIVAEETATHLKEMGINNLKSDVDYQELIISYQIFKENMIDRYLQMNSEDNIIVIYDRALLDSCAYISSEKIECICQRLNFEWNETDILNKYDMILALVSRKDFYTIENNIARAENFEQAKSLGIKTLKYWEKHQNFNVIEPQDTIEEKQDLAISIIEKNIASKSLILK